MSKVPRQDFPLERGVAEEKLAKLLQQLHDSRPKGDPLYEYRRYAALIVKALDEAHVTLHQYPKVVQLKPAEPRGRILILSMGKRDEEELRSMWDYVYGAKKNPVDALHAVVTFIMRHERKWTLLEACRYAIMHVVPAEFKERR